MSLTRRVMAGLGGAILVLGWTSWAGGAENYSLGVIPQQKPSVITENWSPIVKALAETTGVTLNIQPSPDIPTYEQQVQKSEYDFIYTNPYMFVQLAEPAGYKAFANAKGKKIKGILVVQKDSPFQSKGDLADKIVSFPKGAFAADYLLRASLKHDGIVVKPEWSRTHDQGFVEVMRGKFAACGGVMQTFNSCNPEVKDNLRILWTSPGYTPHALAVNPRVPAATVEKVKKAFLAMSSDPNQVKMFKALEMEEGLQTAQNSDWNDVKELAPFIKAVSEI